MKKFLCIALTAATAVFGCALIGCNSGEAVVNYTLSEDGTYYTVTSVSGNKRALKKYEIPATYAAEEGGKQLPVTGIGDEAFAHCSSMSKITLPDSIKSIGNKSFLMSGLVQIDIPDSVESIGYSAFGMCNALEKVVIPESVTSLGDRAFMSCSNLKRAEIYADITELKSLTLYNSVVTTGGNMFMDSSLTEVVLSASIIKIADTALAGNQITDIYYTGTPEQWEDLYFYTYPMNDKGEYEKDDKGEKVEKRLEKTDCIPSSTQIHYNYKPSAE